MHEANNKRKHIRFKPDPMAYAEIDGDAGGHPFKPQTVGLIVNESPMGGCSIITLDYINLNVGDHCRVKVGELAPLLAEVVWKRLMDDHVIRFGFKFLE